MYTFVEEGTVNGGTSWILSTKGTIILDETPLNFTLFDRIGDYTGENVGDGVGIFDSRSGNTLFFRSLQ